MKTKAGEAWKRALAVSAICFILGSQFVLAQNLGNQPATNVAVREKPLRSRKALS